MRNRSLIILSLITLIIIIAAIVSNQKRAPQTVVETSLLFPELKDQINAVAQVSIESSDGAIHINKQGDSWQILESGNYPARFDKIKQTVLGMADMKIMSVKTSTPSLFAGLGVEDTTSENSGSRLLSLKDGTGNVLASLIVGKPGMAGGPGIYVRKPGTNETWLVSGTLDISPSVTDWIEQNLLDITDDRISSTRIEHPDGSVVMISRAKGQENFSLMDVPEGKEARSSYFINQVGTILSKLTTENVKARAGFTFPDTATRTTVRTYDGLVANITTANIEGLNHITLDFSVDESLLPQNQPDKTGEQQAIVIGESTPDAPTASVDVRKEAADLQSNVANWVYIIPSSKYGLLVKQPAELLQDKTTEPPTANTPDA